MPSPPTRHPPRLSHHTSLVSITARHNTSAAPGKPWKTRADSSCFSHTSPRSHLLRARSRILTCSAWESKEARLVLMSSPVTAVSAWWISVWQVLSERMFNPDMISSSCGLTGFELLAWITAPLAFTGWTCECVICARFCPNWTTLTHASFFVNKTWSHSLWERISRVRKYQKSTEPLMSWKVIFFFYLARTSYSSWAHKIIDYKFICASNNFRCTRTP